MKVKERTKSQQGSRRKTSSQRQLGFFRGRREDGGSECEAKWKQRGKRGRGHRARQRRVSLTVSFVPGRRKVDMIYNPGDATTYKWSKRIRKIATQLRNLDKTLSTSVRAGARLGRGLFLRSSSMAICPHLAPRIMLDLPLMVTLSPLGSLWIGNPVGTGILRRKATCVRRNSYLSKCDREPLSRFVGNFESSCRLSLEGRNTSMPGIGEFVGRKERLKKEVR